MKRFILISGLGLMIGMFNINKSEAQIHVSINIDIQPAWGPSGYNYAEYYYIPELNIYYDVIHRLFYYPDGGRWISSMFLPVAYSYYDFYSLYKVVINNVFSPWRYNRNHRHLYHRYCYNYAQVPIYYMRDAFYLRARNNFHGWVEPRYMPHNEGRPRSRDYAMNTRNGRISKELRSSSANEALNNNRSSSRINHEARSRSETTSRTSNSSRERSSANVESTVSRKNEVTIQSNNSRSTATSKSQISSSGTRNNNNASSTRTSKSSEPSANSSRSSSSKSSSSSVSTRSSERSSSGSSITGSSSNSNSRSSNSSDTQSENSSRSERNKR
ncbi:MAG: hypothetical protein LBD80_02455 [Tannerella sp.]|nr:hypothetical protein [Tannerella sp.]